MKHILLTMTLLFGMLQTGVAQNKPRTIVTTDGEIDDVDSFIRMLLYSNEFNLEGLIYSSSQWHYKGDGKGTVFTSEMEMTAKLYGAKTSLRWPGTQWIRDLLKEYSKVYPNLLKHDKAYPSPAYLTKLIHVGNIDFEGEMEKDTEGSNFIKSKLLDNDMSPLFLQIWGGTNTIARALKSIEDEYGKTPQWKSIYEKVCKKTVLYAVLDQDATYRKYVSVKWPDMKIFYNSNQFWCFAYPWPRVVPEALQPYLRGAFMGKNIIKNHGPLLEKYYSWGDGQKQEGDDDHKHGTLEEMNKQKMTQYDFISEGDSPAYFQLIDVGLMNKNNPEYGGWGGRMVQSTSNPHRWEDGNHVKDYNPYTKKEDTAFPQTRWVEALQLDFAARADWCIKPYAEANHAPKLTLKNGNFKKVKAGQSVLLEASATDPDKNQVAFTFWQYPEAGTYPQSVTISPEGNNKVKVAIPSDAQKGQTIHIIVEGRDNGTPSIIRYQRAILTVE
ncbi:DUF1593 domain-containing protein [Flectobacillus sp. DC10W]|uniref:DUF1593 domain-containing protein n=1 Tax=Flectobacillus longus TaxID=2984207 RepID=A0ABT6YIJ1_9BACT|nr:DUF1593 domain-containing protein [Flectobacillus longus]MDI9863416.1 DUF1593 domain-containing protein [Flectobacillus longus]